MKNALPLAAVALVAAGIAWVSFSQGRSDVPAPATTAPTATTGDTAEIARATLPAAATVAAGFPHPGQRGVPEEPSPKEAAAKVEQSIRRLDEELIAEPTDTAWAAPLEHRIQGLFDADKLNAAGIAAPRSIKATCYSQTCRIATDYGDFHNAELAAQMLPMEMGDALEYGAILPRRRSDGSIELNVWLSTKRLTL